MSEDTYLKLTDKMLALRTVPSKLLVDENGLPIQIEVTCIDKVVYTYMKKRFDFFKSRKADNHKGSSYFDKQKEIAEACGVDIKTVTRLVKKWKDNGYINYEKGFGNRINYTKIDSLTDQSVVNNVVVPETYVENSDATFNYLNSVVFIDDNLIPDFPEHSDFYL
jgi:hypothetical protein